MTSEQEDLIKMKERVSKKKVACYDYLYHLLRFDEEMLTTSGYRNKTVAEAMKMAFEMYKGQIQKLYDEFLVKYPD